MRTSLIIGTLLSLAGAGGLPLSAQAPTNNSTRPRPDSVTNESVLLLLSDANRTIIARAQARANTAESVDVRAFAGRMVAEHGVILNHLQQLWNDLGYTAPASSATLGAGELVGNDTRPSSGTDSLADWDYVDREVAYHTRLLAVLQRQAPMAGEERLRAFVANVLLTEEGHLRDARALQGMRPKPAAPETGR